ncbi:MAG TPA: FKBP-type peptidyl-prolyl cis-trans isomerase [bacterium]
MAVGMGEMKVGAHAAPANAKRNESKAPLGPPHPAFLERYQKLPDSRFETKTSGLKVAELAAGDGPAAAKGTSVVVRYTGWTEDGKKFDSSLDKGQPFEFKLGSGSVIKGWEEGLANAKAGERLQLVIPANLAYGKRAVGDIPANSTLVFNVEVVAVNAPAPNTKGTMQVVA